MDVKVVIPFREIAWHDARRLSDDEMKRFAHQKLHHVRSLRCDPAKPRNKRTARLRRTKSVSSSLRPPKEPVQRQAAN